MDASESTTERRAPGPGAPRRRGLLFAAIPAGAVLGGLFSGTFSRARRHGWTVIGAVVVWGAGITGFGLSADQWVSVGFLAVAGVADVLHGTAGSALGPRTAVVGGGLLVVAVMLLLAAAVSALRRYRVRRTRGVTAPRAGAACTAP